MEHVAKRCAILVNAQLNADRRALPARSISEKLAGLDLGARAMSIRYFVIDLEAAKAHGVDIYRSADIWKIEGEKLFVPANGLRFSGTAERQESRKQSEAAALKTQRKTEREAARKAADDALKAKLKAERSGRG